MKIAAAINVSPESFFAGSIGDDASLAERVRAAEADGAALIDIGAMSTAPYKNTKIDAEEETARMARAVSIARAATGLPISADTQRAVVARAAIDAGANIINDVSGLRADPGMGALCAGHGVSVILMANDSPELDEADQTPAEVVLRLLNLALQRADVAGVARDKIILDPGFGFFRHRRAGWVEWDLEILRNLGLFQSLGLPVMVGASRKSFFAQTLGRKDPADRLAGSLAAAAWCLSQNIEWIRVHDVRETADVIATWKGIKNSQSRA